MAAPRGRPDAAGVRVHWRRGTVVATGESWPGAVELEVRLDGGARVPALAHPPLVGTPRAGDAVLVTTTALDLRLGTGGRAHVVALPERLPPDPPPGPGHVVKARYTPLQAAVLAVEEPSSAAAAVMAAADDLGGAPVVVAGLHSALPAVLAGARAVAGPGLRAVWVADDAAALPVWTSRSAARLRAAGWLTGTVSCGQGLGGDVEAVSRHSGLLAARHVLDADLVVLAPGPGGVGTATRWGTTAVASGEGVNAVAVLGGAPVAALRVSGADPRERHRGLSHHDATALGRVALAAADVVVPTGLPAPLQERLAAAVAPLGPPAGRHRLVPVPVAGLRAPLDGVAGATGVRLSTMGRGLDDDPAAFLAAAAAGAHAARLLAGARAPRVT